MRPKLSEDISKPLQNSFIHTGHGSAFGESWGNPSYIDEMYLRNPMDPPDVSGQHSVIYKHRKSGSGLTIKKYVPKVTYSILAPSHLMRSTEKQFSYKKLTNEQSKPQRPPPPKVTSTTNQEGILVDISPDDGQSSIVSVYSTDNKSLSLIDTPIDIPQEGIYLLM